MKEIGLAEAVQAVRQELAAAQRGGEGERIRFGVESVDIEFEVAVARTGGADAKVKVWVVEAGVSGAHEKTTTHRVSVSLVPRTADGPLEIKDKPVRPSR